MWRKAEIGLLTILVLLSLLATVNGLVDRIFHG